MEKSLLNTNKERKRELLLSKLNYSNKLDLTENRQFVDSEFVLLQGRILFLRPIGQITFMILYCFQKEILLIFNKNSKDYNLLVNLDLADIIHVKGNYGFSLTNEESVFVLEWQIITKCLIDIPDKHSKLVSPELIYKNRYLLKPFIFTTCL